MIVPVFKDGDREELDNYWGIALSCTVGKVFERVLDEWIRTVSDEMVMKEAQGGSSGTEEDVQLAHFGCARG